MQLWRRSPLLAKIEGSYGTDPTPTGAANAILAFNGQLDPNPQVPLERRPMQPWLGGARRPIAGRHVTMQFEVEVTGSGTAGDAPAYGPLLRACGLDETEDEGVDTEYAPVSSGWESCTLYWHQHGVLHKGLGARGTVDLVVRAGAVPVWRFAMTALHADPATASLPAADYSGFPHPRPATPAWTPTVTLHGQAVRLRELTLNLGNTVTYREYVNSASVDITDRMVTGTITIEAPALGTKDYFAAAKAETLAGLQLIHGVAAGEIVQLDAARVQLLNPRYVEGDGVADLAMDFSCLPDDDEGGDDEILITVK